MSTVLRSLLLAVALVGCGPGGIVPTTPDGGGEWVPGVSVGPMIPAEDPDHNSRGARLGGSQLSANLALYNSPATVPDNATEVLLSIYGCSVQGLAATVTATAARINSEAKAILISEPHSFAAGECIPGGSPVIGEVRLPMGPRPTVIIQASGPAAATDDDVVVTVIVLGWWMPAP